MSRTDIPARSVYVPGQRITTVEKPGTPTTRTVTTTNRGNFLQARAGNITTNYRKAVREGNLIPNSFVYTEEMQSYRFGKSWNVYQPLSTPTTTTITGVIGNVSLSVPWPSAYTATAGASTADLLALNNFKDMQINLGETLGDFDKTAQMIGKSVGNLANLARSLRSRDPGAFREAMKGFNPIKAAKSRNSDLANAYLAYQYGWMPIINDIYKGIELISKGSVSRSRLVGYAKHTLNDSSTKVTWEGPVKITDVSNWTTDSVTKFIAEAVSQGGPIPEAARYGLTNPLSLAWELTRLSFVVDWCLPIGSFLSALDATLGYSFHSGYRTQFTKASRIITRSGHGPYSNYKDYGEESTTSCEKVHVTRNRLTGFPSPVLIPLFRDPTSISHVASATALFQQSVSGRR